MRMRVAAIFLILGTIGGVALPAHAGVTVYEKDEKKIQVGGRVQVEWVSITPDCSAGVSCLQDDSGNTFDSTFDELFLRRLRPYISGTITEHWMAKIEFDFGAAEDADEVQVKDAYFARSGYENESSKLTIGNVKTVFSREFLNSSAELIVVERGFTGDHNQGVPDRALGVRWESRVRDGKIFYAANIGGEQHDPGVNRMDFDTPVNRAVDWNEGNVAAARVDFYPLGYFKISQADFGRKSSRVAFGLSTFAWRNDGDNNTYTDASGNAINPAKVDLDNADGFEASFAYRGRGVTLDVELQTVGGETVDKAFTGGLYRDGKTDLDKFSIVAGYLFPKERFEVVVYRNGQDATNYEDTFTRTGLNLNWYLNQHNLKFQLTYSMVENFIGIRGQDQTTLFGSTQFKF